MVCRVATVVLTLLVLALPCEARKIRIADDPAKGAETAPLVLVEIGDLQCPACYGYFTRTLPQVEAAYVATGKVRLVFLDFPLDIHSEAFDAAVAAQCAGRQGRFWEYHDQIFTNLLYRPADFAYYAETLDLDTAAFSACLTDPEVAAGIRQDVRQARALGVDSTPTFVLARPREGKEKLKVLEIIRGAKPFEVFQEKLDTHLGAE